MVDVSILLLTKNGCPDLEKLLPAAFAQNFRGTFEVIAVDSGSTDGTVQLLQRFPLHLTQIPPSEFHHARTRNFAARLAGGTILVFLSQDAVPTSDQWLQSMVSNFEDPTVGAVYGRQFPKPGSSLERHDALDAVYGGRKLIKDPRSRDRMGYRFYHFSDANSAIRRSVWEVHGFPEDLKVFEDLGIAKTILDRGWKIVYEPHAAVFHSHTHSTLGLFKRYFDIGYTLKLLEIWDAPGTRDSMLRDGWKLFRGKLKGLSKSACRGSVGHAFQQDIAKSAGLFLGLNESHLPLALKRRFSAFGLFE
jgi:glycosyltransferase involved in cell wall biosynthesis